MSTAWSSQWTCTPLDGNFPEQDAPAQCTSTIPASSVDIGSRPGKESGDFLEKTRPGRFTFQD